MGVVLLGCTISPPRLVGTDVAYYHAWGQWVLSNGLAGAMKEYPTPVALLLCAPLLVTDSLIGYQIIFVGFSVVLCLVAVFLITRLPDVEQGTRGALIFVGCIAVLGPLPFYRFDLLPGVLVAAACVALACEKKLWSVLIGIGTGIKLWPVVLWSLVLGRTKDRKAEVGAFVGTGAGLVALSVLATGWGRLFSPLAWQSDRGLHIESIPASWILVARTRSQSMWPAALSEANSWDFSGPGVDATLVVCTVASIAFFVWCGVMGVRVWRHRVGDAASISLAASSIVALLIVTNKVFSPQYLVWLVPVFAVAVALGGRDLPRWWVPVIVTSCLLTQLSYPTFYGWLLPTTPDWHLLLGTAGMVGRNVMLIVLTVSVCRAAWKSTAPPKENNSV